MSTPGFLLPRPASAHDRPVLSRVDRLGALLTLVGAAGLFLLPFVAFKANRILPGDPRGLAQVLPVWAALACWATLAGIAAVALLAPNAPLRLVAALAGVVVVATALASAANALTPVHNLIVRVAPGAGFWLLLAALGLLATDAITRMRPGPGTRVLLLALFLGIAGFALAHGTFDNVSVMREYAVNASAFAVAARQHVLLSTGSLGGAVIVSLPLGIFCHRVPRLRPGVLSALNIIQTVPSIALFGILMAPLGALAAHVPLAAAVGIRGIGAAPAVVALFLYSLLPIVANTVAGLKRVSPATVEAALGMGMTRWQTLMSVELLLALPVILTGIRIVLVQNIGLVTVAALIGGGGFGTFVFGGIGQAATDLVLLGAIPTVVLAFSAAVLLDALVERLDRVSQ
ncbi:MAG TPA: ABC transporter permease [Steroidobacteraceae bacterium]|nr:ABC transporter permease [Steroidobacteraceae bacterium]